VPLLEKPKNNKPKDTRNNFAFVIALKRAASKMQIPISILILLSAALTGCMSTSSEGRSPDTDAELAKNLSVEDLRVRLTKFADSYLGRIGEVGNEIIGDSESVEARLEMHEARCISSFSVVQLASGANPAASLLDLMSLTRLQEHVWSRQRFIELLDEANHRKLIAAAKDMADQVWAIGSDIMSPSQLARLEQTIDEWLAQNPELDRVSTVRFEDFTKLRSGAALKAEIEETGWFPSIGAVAKSADSAVEFAARTKFVAERMPLLLSWQAELLFCGLVATPEVGGVLDAVTSTSDAIDRLSRTAAELPADLAAQSQELTAVIEAAQATIAQIRELADPTTAVAVQLAETASTLTTTIETADRLAARFSKKDGAAESNARPFNITEYTAAAAEIANAAQEIDETLRSTRELLDSGTLEASAQEIGRAADQRVELASAEAHSLVRSLFAYGLALLGIGCVLAVVAGLLYRFLARRLWNDRSQ
jgi:hypothetical protein